MDYIYDLALFSFGNCMHYGTLYENLSHDDECTFSFNEMMSWTGANTYTRLTSALNTMIKEELIIWIGSRKETDYEAGQIIITPFFKITIHGIMEYWNKYRNAVKEVKDETDKDSDQGDRVAGDD